MVKILGKISKSQKSQKSQYVVKRKNRKDCMDVSVLYNMYGKSNLKNCQKTCDILNLSEDNFGGKKGTEKLYYYFPSIY